MTTTRSLGSLLFAMALGALAALFVVACGPAGTAQIKGDGPVSPAVEPLPPSKDVTMTDYQDFSEIEPVDEGGLITLSNEIGQGPVVLVFYRGHWCKYCREQLGDLNGLAREFELRGARLIAVSADRPEDVRAVVADQELTYTVLSDEDLSTIDAYGLREEGEEFSRPATLVIAPDGSIVYERIGESASDRPTAEEVLEQLDRIVPQEDATP